MSAIGFWGFSRSWLGNGGPVMICRYLSASCSEIEGGHAVGLIRKTLSMTTLGMVPLRSEAEKDAAIMKWRAKGYRVTAKTSSEREIHELSRAVRDLHLR